MRKLIVAAIALAAFVAVFGAGCTTTKIVVATPTTQLTPTLSAEQIAYTQAVATSEAVQARLDREATTAAELAKPTRTPIPPPYKLALISASCSRTESYITCEGFVENISGVSLKNVVAVLELLDDNGVAQASDDALIGYDPILPGQQSPWKVIARNNPAFTKSNVEFKEFGGATILTRQDQP